MHDLHMAAVIYDFKFWTRQIIDNLLRMRGRRKMITLHITGVDRLDQHIQAVHCGEIAGM